MVALLDEYYEWVSENFSPEEMEESIRLSDLTVDTRDSLLSGRKAELTGKTVRSVENSDFYEQLCDRLLSSTIRDFLSSKGMSEDEVDDSFPALEAEVIQNGFPKLVDVTVEFKFDKDWVYSLPLELVGGFDYDFCDDVSLPSSKDEHLRELLSIFRCSPRAFAEKFLDVMSENDSIPSDWEHKERWVNEFSDETEKKMRAEMSWATEHFDDRAETLARVATKMMDSGTEFKMCVVVEKKNLDAVVESKESSMMASQEYLPPSLKCAMASSALFKGRVSLVSADETFNVEDVEFDFSFMSPDSNLTSEMETWGIHPGDFLLTRRDFFVALGEAQGKKITFSETYGKGVIGKSDASLVKECGVELGDIEVRDDDVFSFRYLPGAAGMCLMETPFPYERAIGEGVPHSTYFASRSKMEWLLPVACKTDEFRNESYSGLNVLSRLLVSRQLSRIGEILPFMDCNARNEFDGSTPLHFLTGELTGLFLEKFLSAGADPLLKDEDGKTAPDRNHWTPEFQSMALNYCRDADSPSKRRSL